MNAAVKSGIFAVIGMAIVGLIDNFVNAILQDASIWQFHGTRSAMVLALLVIFAQRFNLQLGPRNWRAVTARAVLIALSMILYFGALPILPIAQVGAGLFTSPIWVLIFSMVIYRQKIGPRRIFAVAIGTLGVIAMMRPEAANFSWFSLIPVLAGALYGLANIFTWRYCAAESTTSLLVGSFGMLGLMGLAGVLVTTFVNLPAQWLLDMPFLAQGFQVPTQSFWLLTIIQALGSLLAVALITRAYQGADTSYVTIYEYTFLIFASFWGWQLNAQAIDARDILGIALIIGAGIVVAISTERQAAARA